MSNATIKIARDNLNRALMRTNDTAAKGALAKRKPVLGKVRINVNGSVSLESTDMERKCTDVIACSRSGDADVCVDAKALKAAVQSQPRGAELDISIDDESVKIGGISLPHISGDEFPHLAAEDDARCSVDVPGRVLAELIENCMYACDTESSRYALGALLVEMDDTGYLRLVGTDGRRLATDYTRCHQSEIETALWPVKAAKGALKAIKKADKCTLTVGKYISLVCYHDEGTTGYIFRQVDGRFPKWREVIPEHARVCQVSADDLLPILEQMKAAGVDDTTKRSAVDMSIGDGLLTMSAAYGACFLQTDCDTHLATTTLPEIRLDTLFLLEMVKALKGHQLTISAKSLDMLQGQEKQSDFPLRIECTSFDYIVMPLAK